MKGEIQNYKKYIEKASKDESTDKKQLSAELLTRIQFYQHERLIHLIVTMSFGVFFLISLILCSINILCCALSALLLILLVPYIAHYYFLENSVQRLYEIYYSITENASNMN